MNSILTLMFPEISVQTSRISGCIKTGDMSVNVIIRNSCCLNYISPAARQTNMRVIGLAGPPLKSF